MDAPLSVTIQILEAVAILALGIGLAMVAVTFRDIRRDMRSIQKSLADIGREARPVFDRARAIGENVNYIVMSMRREVDRVGETISQANDRLESALEVAETKALELSALIEVVQDEVEDTVLTATSALRGLRTGAKVLRTGLRKNDSDSDAEEEGEE